MTKIPSQAGSTWIYKRHLVAGRPPITTTRHSHYISNTTLKLFQRVQHGFDVFSPSKNSRRTIHFQPTGRTSYIPLSSHPIDTTTDQAGISINKQHIQQHNETTQPNIQTLLMRIESLPLWEKELIHCHKLFDNDETLSRLLSMDIVIATDGSYKDDKGSYGWIITTSNDIYLAKGSGTVFSKTLSSFHCEGYGILAALRFILLLRLHFHQPVPNTTITWWCDSLSLLQRLAPQPIPNPNRSKLADHDVESSIRHSVPLVTTKLQSIHIRSHQYDNEPLESIPLPHKLNRIADQLAIQHLSQISQPTSKAPLLDPARCQLHIGGNTITRALPMYLRSAFSDKHIRTHLLRRLDIAPNLDILWPSFSSAFHKLSTSQQRKNSIRRYIRRLIWYRRLCYLDPVRILRGPYEVRAEKICQ